MTKRRTAWLGCAALMLAAPSARGAEPAPSEDERRALARLAESLEGAVVYGHQGRIHKVTIGADPRPVDLGPGGCARFSPDGKRLAAYGDRAVFVMNADGSDRRAIASEAASEDGCPVEFHANGREVIFLRKKQGFFIVPIAGGEPRKLALPGPFTGEPGISADGKRLAIKADSDLYAVDLVRGTHRKYAKGCSPGVSPDGRWLMRNVGGHHRLRIESWEGDRGFEIDAATCLPDQRWDNHHWSNHPNWIAAQGDRRGNFIYVVDVSGNRGTRVTWERGDSPDLFVKRTSAPGTLAAAAAPPAPAAAAAGRSGRAWPGREEGLVFLWEDAARPNEVRAAGRVVRTCRPEPRDAARFTRHHGMELSGGGFVADEIDGPLREAVRASGALTFEAIVTPPPDKARERKGGRIVSFGDNFVLRDSREDLRLYLRTSEAAGDRDRDDEDRETVLGHLPGGRPTHVVISYRPGLLVFYADGREAFRTPLVRGGLDRFTAGKLVFGAGERDRSPWRGSLEAVAIYGRFVDAAEAADKHALARPRLERRGAAPEAIAARGRVVEASAVPDPASIAPYRRALVVSTYEILEGPEPLRGKRVQVAHWGVLDGRVVGRTARIKPGDERKLRLEPFATHPELESERLVDDGAAAAPDLPLFHDVSPVDRNELAPASARGQVSIGASSP